MKILWRIRSVALVFLTCVWLPTPTRAQQSYNYSIGALDLSVGNLEPKYHGHDPEELFSVLSAGRTKGEFETTAEYNQRLIQIENASILGSLTYGSVYAFYVQDSEIDARYDADSRILAVSIELEPIHMERPEVCSPNLVRLGLCKGTEHYVGAHAFLSKTKMLSLGEYTGTNSYGATTVVKSERRDQFKITFSNLEDFPTQSGLMGEDICVRLSMDAISAQRAKGNLGVLAVSKLVSPYVTSNLGYHEPTLAEPYKLDSHFNFIHVHILALWVYDKSSGQVLAKIRGTDKPMALSPEAVAKIQEECSAQPAQAKCRVLSAKTAEDAMRKSQPDVRITLSDSDDTTIILQLSVFDNQTARDTFQKEIRAKSDFQKSLCLFGFRRMVLKPSTSGLPTTEFDLGCL
jgi:hypothetical protein